MSTQTPIRSGGFNAGTDTPTGAPFKVEVDNPYITKDDYINSFEASGLGITASAPQYASGELERMILRASSMVNSICNRWFDTQTVDYQKTNFSVRPYNPQLVTVVLPNRPYQKINSIYIQVLQWFIQVDTQSAQNGGYLQDFPTKGFYKIVPLLSSAGTGAGSPIPASILDRVPLGVLWTNYTFGYGTAVTAEDMKAKTPGTIYQADLGRRLIAPDQPHKVYVGGVLADPATYTLDCPNAQITFSTPIDVTAAVTADYVSNQSMPQAIVEAVIKLVTHMIGQAQQNALGAKSLRTQTYSIDFGEKSNVRKEVEEILDGYTNIMPEFF